LESSQNDIGTKQVWLRLDVTPADLFRARPTGTFEFPKYGFELARKLVKQLDQIQGILQCYRGPLSFAWAHGTRGIADKDHAILVLRWET